MVRGLEEADERETRRMVNGVYSDLGERDKEVSLELLYLFLSVRGQ